MIFKTNTEFGAYIKSCGCKDLLKLYRENQEVMRKHKTTGKPLPGWPMDPFGAMMDNLEIYPILRNNYNYSRKDLI